MKLSPRYLSAWGNSSPRVTADIYAHAITGRDREAARKWEEFQRRSIDEHLKQ
jgi:hypothetical protein